MVSATAHRIDPPDAAAQEPEYDQSWCPRCYILGRGDHVTRNLGEAFPHQQGVHEWGRLLALTVEEAVFAHAQVEGVPHVPQNVSRPG